MGHMVLRSQRWFSPELVQGMHHLYKAHGAVFLGLRLRQCHGALILLLPPEYKHSPSLPSAVTLCTHSLRSLV